MQIERVKLRTIIRSGPRHQVPSIQPRVLYGNVLDIRGWHNGSRTALGILISSLHTSCRHAW